MRFTVAIFLVPVSIEAEKGLFFSYKPFTTQQKKKSVVSSKWKAPTYGKIYCDKSR